MAYCLLLICRKNAYKNMRSGHGPKVKARMSEISKVIYGQKSVEELTGMCCAVVHCSRLLPVCDEKLNVPLMCSCYTLSPVFWIISVQMLTFCNIVNFIKDTDFLGLLASRVSSVNGQKLSCLCVCVLTRVAQVITGTHRDL